MTDHDLINKAINKCRFEKLNILKYKVTALLPQDLRGKVITTFGKTNCIWLLANHGF